MRQPFKPRPSAMSSSADTDGWRDDRQLRPIMQSTRLWKVVGALWDV